MNKVTVVSGRQPASQHYLNFTPPQSSKRVKEQIMEREREREREMKRHPNRSGVCWIWARISGGRWRGESIW